jgi:hypothetical protein
MRMVITVLAVGLVAGWFLANRLEEGALAGTTNRYIVQFDGQQVTSDEVDTVVAEFEATYGIQAWVVYRSAILGFSADMSEDTANAITQDTRVLTVEQDASLSTQWGDANCDGATNALDASDILRHVAGLPYREGIGCHGGGIGTADTP